ncbi:MAG: hypothetical protein COU63_01040 [Candidatus Pacebacteria bacterium CG10_big_fil_rev_8_21_14_0_10_36_11]|nr:hypothetical protein [Candidatus Pacearchaeota archaeon]OIP74603.1 MAG: hypothetical protein AUK08_00640 [Candidatus Pacebacteria bacterium CG2_30_36_39]PIR65231.1 MAG: hypothetical protein COU63_01040 [Candidatus Pacebacteria bacterium CG10_big_fil_rev_8_21_14_0_10_36_11]PJC42552.1 MAG: hypothetical protein CO040_03770 [Candidatus Pacebacteria bacterium CG_4_9_14_0_2_um_filter_36_8]
MAEQRDKKFWQMERIFRRSVRRESPDQFQETYALAEITDRLMVHMSLREAINVLSRWAWWRAGDDPADADVE